MHSRLSAILTKIGCYLERVVTGVDRGSGAKVIRALLWPLSMLYCACLKVYLSLYKSGRRKQTHLGVPVISIGNLTFGGTGKTPAVITVCRMLQAAGHHPVVLSRGHGGTAKHGLVVSNGNDILCNSKRCGDEPMVLARSLPGVPVITGKDRRHSGNLACKLFNPSVIVLDDGMQYWQLYRDCELVVMNAERPFGSDMVMPAGDLREPKNGLKRAGAILLNGTAEISKDAHTRLLNTLSVLAPKVPVFACSKIPSGFIDARTGETFGIDWVRGRKIVAFCGIGSPQSFERMLNDFGAEVFAFIAFRDHQKYTKQDINRIITEKTTANAEFLVTTEKDASRLNPGLFGNDKNSAQAPNNTTEMPNDLFILEIELEVEETLRFEEHITNRINTAHKATSAEETPDQTTG